MLEFIFPKNGFFLNSGDGEWTDNALNITVQIKSDKAPTINGVIATPVGDCYTATIALTGFSNQIIAASDDEQTKITVFVIPQKYNKRYRISSDDNIRFLKELNDGDYKSIFDHPYLAIYKKAHDLYGAKVHLNLFYEFCDKARAEYSEKHDYFDLSMMTDKYKDEFIANSNWLKLSFHANTEYPELPYKFATKKALHDDYVALCREICRFAGNECISACTTIHWGGANEDVVSELRALGIKIIVGYFRKNQQGEPVVSYHLDQNMLEFIENRDFWLDTKHDIICAKIDRVLNYSPLEEILTDVENTINDPHKGGFVEIMIHEQYFYTDYHHYLSNFEERILKPCKMLYESGYVGEHLSDMF